MAYKLSSVLYGHTMDVRAVTANDDGFVVSASRDKTAKLWKPNGENAGYTEVQTFKGHTNYVTSVAMLNKSKILPNGIIVTGGNDNLICGFVPESPEPIFVETTHTNTVCKINPGVLANTFLSSSWDMTARLWQINVGSDQTYEPVVVTTFEGHTFAIWSSIQLSSRHVVTCSADKTILIHEISPSVKSSVIVKKLTGHTDCVRDLAVLINNEFLSCSNDATVKHWNAETGECLETFYGHPNYIYSLSVFFGTDISNSLVVTGGEDRYLNVWQNSDQQVILQPAQSIWAVTILPNTDIVVGSSDGLVRIFSTDSNRQASEEAQAAFQEQVNNVNQSAQKEVGGIKVDSLPGPEALYKPGKNDGQVMMVNENGKPICYQWLSNECKWDKVGDVLSAADPNKNMHEGKEYDFVWSVDVEDGGTPLKLPFNRDEDPWTVAQAFIHKHNLPQSYLETVANFIITNSKGVAPPLPVNQNYADPYTGASRYIPSSNSTLSSGTYGKNHSTGQVSSGFDKCFPQDNYLKFDHQANTTKILSKIEEFNKKAGNVFSQNQLESLIKLCDVNNSPDEQSVTILVTSLDWPKDILFPILDITRLAVRNKFVNDKLCSNNLIMNKLLPHFYDIENPTNQMLAIRSLCNLMHHENGELVLVNYYEELLKFIQTLSHKNLAQKHLQVAVATLLLNLSVMIKQSEDALSIQYVNDTVNMICPRLTEPEAMFHCFVAIGTLLSAKYPPTLSEHIRDYIKLMASNSEPSKVLSCCKHLVAVIGK